MPDRETLQRDNYLQNQKITSANNIDLQNNHYKDDSISYTELTNFRSNISNVCKKNI